MEETNSRKLYFLFALIPLILVQWFGRVILSEFCVYLNHTTTFGTVGEPAWDGHGIHYYEFEVEGKLYNGKSQIFGGDRTSGSSHIVYYFPPFPRFSSMRSASPPNFPEVVITFALATVSIYCLLVGFGKIPLPSKWQS